LLKLLNANNIIFTMPRFLSKMQGEFSLKEVGYESFITGGAKPKPLKSSWNSYNNWKKSKGVSEDVADSPVWRFKINQKIRVFAILNEITENNVIAFILWIDPNHKSG